jgi:hypothetical protein
MSLLVAIALGVGIVVVLITVFARRRSGVTTLRIDH